jgi:hypothetical protein
MGSFGASPELMHVYPDPRSAAHGCAAFSDRATDGESENPGTNDKWGCLLEEAFFFGSFLLALSKRNEHARRRRVEAFASAFDARGPHGKLERFSSTGGAEFISFGRPQKEWMNASVSDLAGATPH